MRKLDPMLPYSDFLLHDVDTGDGILQALDHEETLDQRSVLALRFQPDLRLADATDKAE